MSNRPSSASLPLILTLMTGCSPQMDSVRPDNTLATTATSDTAAQEQRNVDTIKQILQGFKTGNVAQIDELVHEDFVNHHAPEGVRNREGFKQIVQQVHAMFSSFDDFDLQAAHIFGKGNYVAMMDQGRGTKNGKPYQHVDIHIFIMEDGKMKEHWNSFGLPSQQDILMKFMQDAQ